MFFNVLPGGQKKYVLLHTFNSGPSEKGHYNNYARSFGKGFYFGDKIVY